MCDHRLIKVSAGHYRSESGWQAVLMPPALRDSAQPWTLLSPDGWATDHRTLGDAQHALYEHLEA